MMLGMDKSATALAALMREQYAFDRGLKARTIQLRDQFATAALTGIAGNLIPQTESAINEMAECAYLLADAMLAARAK